MLILTRRGGESLMIGENIEVKVLEVKGDTVKLGIAAPREIPVHRQEVFATIREENKAAAQVKKDILLSLPQKNEK